MDAGSSEHASKCGGRRNKEEHGSPEHPVLTAEGHGATHAYMKEGQSGDDEKASLAETHGEPESDCGCGIAANSIASCTPEVFTHSLPCEDGEGKEIATCEPEVAPICRRNRPIVRKTKFRLLDEMGVSELFWANNRITARGIDRTYGANSTAERVGWENRDKNAKNDER